MHHDKSATNKKVGISISQSWNNRLVTEGKLEIEMQNCTAVDEGLRLLLYLSKLCPSQYLMSSDDSKVVIAQRAN